MAFLPGAMGRLGHTIKEHLDGSDAKSNASSIGDAEMVLLPPWGSPVTVVAKICIPPRKRCAGTSAGKYLSQNGYGWLLLFLLMLLLLLPLLFLLLMLLLLLPLLFLLLLMQLII